MRDRPIRSLAYRTDRMLVRAWGGHVLERGPYRAFVSPPVPDHFNGNFLLHDAPPDEDAVVAWPAAFRREIPPTERGHLVQLGWDDPRATPEDAAPFTRAGFGTACWDVLTAPRLAAPALPAGIAVRPLAGDADWAALVAMLLEDFDPAARSRLAPYFGRMAGVYRGLGERGLGVTLGAFDGARLAGTASAFAGDGLARYQWIMTAPGDRRRGICRALLQAAGGWCTERGAEALVIVATRGDPAAATYEAAGFRPVEAVVRIVKRLPAPEPTPTRP
jgi:GNAT superfamily N-acetyltransferase